MKTNKEGLDLLKSFEGCKLKSYKDIVGVWTIGYGSTGPDIVAGLSWTQKQADDRLARDLEKFEAGVLSCVKEPLNENEFSALVCFSYNVGTGALQKSTLVKILNTGDKLGAADQLMRWNKAGGKEVPGLTRRRQAERALFLKTPTKSGGQLPDGPSDQEINVKLEDIEKQ